MSCSRGTQSCRGVPHPRPCTWYGTLRRGTMIVDRPDAHRDDQELSSDAHWHVHLSRYSADSLLSCLSVYMMSTPYETSSEHGRPGGALGHPARCVVGRVPVDSEWSVVRGSRAGWLWPDSRDRESVDMLMLMNDPWMAAYAQRLGHDTTFGLRFRRMHMHCGRTSCTCTDGTSAGSGYRRIAFPIPIPIPIPT